VTALKTPLLLPPTCGSVTALKTPLLLPPTSGSVTALKTPLLLPPTCGSAKALKTPLLLPPTSGSGATPPGGAINVSAPSMFTAAVACAWFGGTFTIPTNSYVRGPVFFHSITCASFVTCVRSIFDLELSDARDEAKPSQDEAKSKKESNATMSRRFANMSTPCEREAFREILMTTATMRQPILKAAREGVQTARGPNRAKRGRGAAQARGG
jgi:hypothetical protein